jgi:hypothetical protein
MKIGFEIDARNGYTLSLYNTGWKLKNKHYKISSFCWAMYLRILKRHIDTGEMMPYEKSLDA